MSDYRRGRFIARGKTGTVYEGEHILTGFIYALKVFDKTIDIPKYAASPFPTDERWANRLTVG